MTDVQVLLMFLFWNVIHDRCSSAFNVFVFGFENGQTTAPKMGVEICHRTGAIGTLCWQSVSRLVQSPGAFLQAPAGGPGFGSLPDC